MLLLYFIAQITVQANEPYYVYDMRPLQKIDRDNPNDARRIWDETLFISALQGLANRDSARLYILFIQAYNKNSDLFWLDVFSKETPSNPPKKGWLQEKERKSVNSIEELLEIFDKYYEGVVLYDENVPATVNAALTVAGVENLIPLRFDLTKDSLYDRVVLNGPKLQVKARLVNEDGSSLFTGSGKIPGTNLDSTGSSKADVYYWTIEHYFKTKRVNPLEGAYYIDAFWLKHPDGVAQNHCLTNRDFTVSRKGFFFDLSPWEDETPNDDPKQPLGTDFNAFNAIMKAAYDASDGKKIIRVCGFTPWNAKYTNYGNVGCKRGGVQTEWRHAEILSNYNAYLDADALGLCAMANASFFQHFPLKSLYPQKKPTVEELKKKGYVDETGAVVDNTFVAIYSGDYDSAAWAYQCQTQFWFDDTRGEIPISWAFNPNLADRFAPGFDYIRNTASENDYFVSGDSGAGYINPEGFVEPRKFSKLPDALDVWIEHSLEYFKRWDISGIGFVIDGDARTSNRRTLERLSKYAPDGMTVHRGDKMGVVDNPYGGKTAFRPMNFDLANPEQGAKIILGDTRLNKGAQFNMYRTILWSPSQLKTMFELVKNDPIKGKRIVFVDAYSFWKLIELEAKRIGKDEFDLRL